MHLRKCLTTDLISFLGRSIGKARPLKQQGKGYGTISRCHEDMRQHML